ncbi:MAG: hypothetical protein U9R34_01905 [Nanoarchaeota archaeon]|nr:hypothetical protein [Nanoarchaeota archaeon]
MQVPPNILKSCILIIILIEGARHGWNYALNPAEYKGRVMKFFDKHLKE